MLVKKELTEAGIEFSISPHDAIEFREDISNKQLDEINANIQKAGLELLNEKNSLLIDRIIGTIVEMVHDSEELPAISFEDVISRDFFNSNDKILKIFSDVKGVSLIQFIVQQKVERIKEWLIYEDYTLSEMAEKLRYKNEDFLIAQFKKHTGLSPSYYKKLKKERNKVLHTS
jgi:YesN/AraC family two-component response regulator